MPLSNNTVSWCIGDMAADVLKQLPHHSRAREFYALQLDKSKDVAGLAHLLVPVLYIHEGTIKDMLLQISSKCWTPLWHQMDLFGRSVLYCTVCTDGAKAMTGSHSRVVTCVQAVASDATWVHCSNHWEALAAKGIPGSLKRANFVKARPLNSRIFTTLCNEMGIYHETVMLCTEAKYQHVSLKWKMNWRFLLVTINFKCQRI